MNTIRIDKDRALQLLREVVAGYGADYVYPLGSSANCVYERKGQPSCLVGHALNRAGLTVEQLSEMDGARDEFGDLTAIDDVPLPEDVEVTDGARVVFRSAQVVQDNGGSWGEALSKAEREAVQR